MAQSAKDKLVDFLDKHAFRPVIEAKPERYPEGDRDRLRHVQRATQDEMDRYRHYESAEKVYRMYRDDLSSGAAKRVHDELRHLGLPTLDEVRDGFERLAEEVGAKR